MAQRKQTYPKQQDLNVAEEARLAVMETARKKKRRPSRRPSLMNERFNIFGDEMKKERIKRHVKIALDLLDRKVGSTARSAAQLAGAVAQATIELKQLQQELDEGTPPCP